MRVTASPWSIPFVVPCRDKIRWNLISFPCRRKYSFKLNYFFWNSATKKDTPSLYRIELIWVYVGGRRGGMRASFSDRHSELDEGYGRSLEHSVCGTLQG